MYFLSLFWLSLYCLSFFELRLHIIPLITSNVRVDNCFPFSFGNCIVYHFSIYYFWLPPLISSNYDFIYDRISQQWYQCSVTILITNDLLKPLAITTYRSISSSNGFHQVSNNSCASYKVSKCFSHNIARLRYQSQPFFIHYFSVTVFGVIVKNERAKYKTINCS